MRAGRIYSCSMAKSEKIGFRQSLEAYRNIMQDLKAGKFSGCYLLMGAEGFFIDRISDYLAEHVLQPDERGFNQTVVYGRDSDVVDVVDYCRQYPMMSAYNVVILKEAQQLKNFDQLQYYVAEPHPSTIFVICYKEGSVDKRSKLYKRISEIGVVFESAEPRDYEIGSWIADLVRLKGCTIDDKSVALLVEHLGIDLAKIDNELDKLLTNLPQGTTVITSADIERNIGISKDFNVFELTRALSQKDAAKAMRIADYFAGNPSASPLVVTNQLLFTHFLRIFTLGMLQWESSKKRKPMPSDAELMKLLKLSSVYFLREYREALRYYPPAKSFAIMGEIRTCDMRSKGVESGSAGDGELLWELLFKILQ